MRGVTADIQTTRLRAVARVLAERLGLAFPESAWPTLVRGVEAAAEEIGLCDPAAYLDRLVTIDPTDFELQTLASHLTVGETYFLREPESFHVLERDILPPIIAARASGARELRLWSAGTCSGEEAYSLAISAARAAAATDGWNVSVLGTDVNPKFLAKANAGVYSHWSFRGCPTWLSEVYFSRSADGKLLSVIPAIRNLVHFRVLNMAADIYPSIANQTAKIDVIFCRNVLLYLTYDCQQRVIAALHRCMGDGGVLVVAPAEALAVQFPMFAAETISGVQIFRKTKQATRRAVAGAGVASRGAAARHLASDFRLSTIASNLTLARTGAAAGQLREALVHCERAVTAQPSDVGGRLLGAPPVKSRVQYRKPVQVSKEIGWVWAAAPARAAARDSEPRDPASALSGSASPGQHDKQGDVPGHFLLAAGRLVDVTASGARLAPDSQGDPLVVTAPSTAGATGFLPGSSGENMDEHGIDGLRVPDRLALAEPAVAASTATPNFVPVCRTRLFAKVGDAPPPNPCGQQQPLLAYPKSRTRSGFAIWGTSHEPDPAETSHPSVTEARVTENRPAGPEETQRFEVIAFALAGETFAVESRFVAGAFPLENLTSLPSTPPFIAGMIYRSGRVLAVVDLRVLFDMPSHRVTELNRVVVLKHGEDEFGVMADSVAGLQPVVEHELQAALPTASGVRERYLLGMTSNALLVLDAARLLTDPSLKVGGLATEHADVGLTPSCISDWHHERAPPMAPRGSATGDLALRSKCLV